MALVLGPAHGVLALNADGSFLYRPQKGFVGKDTFTYAAHDALQASNVVTVTIDVHKHDHDKDDDHGENGDHGDHGDGRHEGRQR